MKPVFKVPACNKRCCLILSLFFLLPFSSRADVSLSGIFGDHAVLQRDRAVPIWGWAEPGEKVSVSFAGSEKKTVAGKDGSWRISLDAMPASSGPRDLVVSGENTITLKDILVGDVWLCSGQSNMAWPVARATNASAEKASADYPAIRHIAVPQKKVESPDETIKADWTVCSPETVARWSAVGYFFGRELHRKLDVPIGLINSSVGGSPIEFWIPSTGFINIPELAEMAADSDSPFAIPAETWRQRGCFFNGMIYPLIPYALRGVVWYQGEANGHLGEGVSYFHKQKALIKIWRDLWLQGDIPFYYVQLANFGLVDTTDVAGGKGWPKLREAQMKCLEIPRTAMAVAIDIGETRNIHPGNKQDVGLRLAYCALADEYNRDVTGSGPLYRRFDVENDKIRLYFDNTDGGLIAGEKTGLDPVKPVESGVLHCFAIAGADQKFYWAEAVVDGDTVVVASDKVKEPVAVRYAYSTNPQGANLYNKEGLPASPFRTDDW